MTTVDGGANWTRISPELGVPKGLDSTGAANVTGGRGAIESISASTVTPGIIWVGTNNGLIHVTRDEGKTWSDVSIPDLPRPRRANVSAIEASHHETGTAYAAVEFLRMGDHTPYVYRTRDFGKTWTKIVTGLPADEPSGSFVRVIRADTKKRGLLFAGTESGLHVSFDDGDHWQSLMQNLPNAPYRDITIKGNDLIAGTHGRGIWILDDISMLRQLTPAVVSERAHLFAPGDAYRVRRNVNADTPLPPEIPHALNPADGVIVDYWLSSRPSADITLDVLDAAGRIVRHMSSAAVAPVEEAMRPPHPNFWVAPPVSLPMNAGGNRVNWDVRFDAPPAFRHSFEISANPGLTPPSPEGVLALPGVYTLKLTVDGKSQSRTVTVRNDPRSPATLVALRAQDSLLMRITEAMHVTWDGNEQAVALRAAVSKVAGAGAAAEVSRAAAVLLARIDSAGGGTGGRGGRGGAGGAAALVPFRSVNDAFAGQLNAQDNADMAPTPAMRAAYGAVCRDLAKTEAFWRRVTNTDLAAFNAVLTKSGMSAVALPGRQLPIVTCQAV